MTVDPAACTKQLVAAAASPYQRASMFAWRFARGKLAGDPLFTTLSRTAALPDASCLVDLGCGQGLLATWLHATRNAWLANEAPDSPTAWPADWPAPPKIATYLGIDQSRADIARARPAMPAFARVFRGDVRTMGLAMLDRCDVVTLFDVLQYFDPAAQERLIGAIARALPPWGVMVLRIGDAAGDGSALSSRWTNLVDLVVCALRGHPRWKMHRRTLVQWRALLEQHGFVVEVLDDDRVGSAPSKAAFANVLLRASRPQPEVAVEAASLR